MFFLFSFYLFFWFFGPNNKGFQLSDIFIALKSLWTIRTVLMVYNRHDASVDTCWVLNK